MKQYKFMIRACSAYRGASEGMVMMMPFSTIHNEEFTGTLKELEIRVRWVKHELIESRKFENGCGFSLYPMLCGNQNKPRGYDASRRTMSTNYIREELATA